MSTTIRRRGAGLGALLVTIGLGGCLGGPAPETEAGPTCGVGTSPSIHMECLVLQEEAEDDLALEAAVLDEALAESPLAPRPTDLTDPFPPALAR